MNKNIKKILKCALISITANILYRVVRYWKGEVEGVEIKELIIASIIVFAFLCVLALLHAPLRKLFGHRD